MSNIVFRKGVGAGRGMFVMQLNGPAAWGAPGGANLATLSTGKGDLRLSASASDAAGGGITVQAGTGRIGVGKSQPSAALDVSGGVCATSYVDGSGFPMLSGATALWTAYSPTFAQDDGTGGLSVGGGGGALVGRYFWFGTMVTVEIGMTLGSGTTLGSASRAWAWTLPVAPAAGATAYGTALLRDASTGGAYSGIAASLTAAEAASAGFGSGAVRVLTDAQTRGVGQHTVFDWAEGDSMALLVSYEASAFRQPTGTLPVAFLQSAVGSSNCLGLGVAPSVTAPLNSLVVAGAVGVGGTASPACALDVSGDVRVTRGIACDTLTASNISAYGSAGGVVAGGTAAFAGLTVSGLTSTSNLFTSNATVVGTVYTSNVVTSNATVTGRLTSSNMVSSNVTVYGDVTAAKYHGDGSLLTNLPSSGGGGGSLSTPVQIGSLAVDVFPGTPALEISGNAGYNNDCCIQFTTNLNVANSLVGFLIGFDIPNTSAGTTHSTYPYISVDPDSNQMKINASGGFVFSGGTTTSITGTRTMTATGTTATFKILNYTTSLNNTSDSRLKKNITQINAGSLELIEQLNPVTYQWNELHHQLFSAETDASGNDVTVADTEMYPGFIAQEMETVFPLAVGSMDVSDTTYKTLKPMALIPYLVKAIQELSAQNKELSAQNKMLSARVSALEAHA